MKKYVIAVFISVVCFMFGLAAYKPNTNYDLEGKTSATRQRPYELQINSVTSDDTALTAATKYWDLIKPDNGVFVRIDPTWNYMQFAFYCYGDGDGDGDPNGADFDFRIHAAKWYGSSELAFVGYAQCGEVELSCDPTDGSQFNSGSLDPNESYKWVDTIDPNGVGEDWISEVQLSGNSGTATGGNVAKINLDLNGYWIVWVEITNMTSKDVTSVTCVASGY